MFYLISFKVHPKVHATEMAMDINKAHKNMGYIGEEVLCKTMTYYNVKLTGTLKACNVCMHAKAKAKSLKKATKTKATQPSEWLYLDASRPFKPSIGGSKFDAKLVDYYSHKTWTAHIKNKTQIANLVKQHLDELKGQGKHMKYLQCDNAPKHSAKLNNICKDHSVVHIEFTALYKPQQSGMVKQKIVTDCDCAMAMLIGAWLTKGAQALLHAEAESTATCLSNMIWNKQVQGIPNVLFNGDSGKLWPKHLIKFGHTQFYCLASTHQLW